MNRRSRFLLGMTGPSSGDKSSRRNRMEEVRERLGYTLEEMQSSKAVRDEVYREYSNVRNHERRQGNNDIGELPSALDPARRGVCSLSLLQGIFPIPGSNPGLLH